MLRHHGVIGVRASPSLAIMFPNPRIFIVLLVFAILIGGASMPYAQNGSHIAEPASPPPSRWLPASAALNPPTRSSAWQ